jgi:Xaa-Pro aminopeptidase
MPDISSIQAALRAFDFDGWLLTDFRGSNLLARRVLGLEAKPPGSRRWYYFIPRDGEPKKLVHRIETAALDHLPGQAAVYLRWQELENGIAHMTQGAPRIAMEYAPGISNPYISRVDAGTIELVRSLGHEVGSSGDLVQLFEATWDDMQWASHLEVDRHTRAAFDLAWSAIARAVRSGTHVSELSIQAEILNYFRHHNLTTYSPPNVSVNAHAGDPHYDPSPATDAPIREGDLVLIDLWARVDRPRTVYSDLTRVGFVGAKVPDRYQRAFEIVAQGRDAAIQLVKNAFANDRPLQGYQVDDACRAVIDATGEGPYFAHRTGHSLGQEVHGNGAHIDNLETHEERLILRRTAFTIEPGLYYQDFGVRSEINVFIDAQGVVHVTGGPLQYQIVPILALDT